MREKIIDFVLDLLITSCGEATGNRKKQIEENISLYANDYTKGYIELHGLKLTTKEINEIIDEIIEQYENL